MPNPTYPGVTHPSDLPALPSRSSLSDRHEAADGIYFFQFHYVTIFQKALHIKAIQFLLAADVSCQYLTDLRQQ